MDNELNNEKINKKRTNPILIILLILAIIIFLLTLVAVLFYKDKVNDEKSNSNNNNVITDNKKTNDVEEKDESLLLAEELMKNFTYGVEDTYFFEKDEYTYETISNDKKIEMAINYLDFEKCKIDCDDGVPTIITKAELNNALDSIFGRHDNVTYNKEISSKALFAGYKYNESTSEYEVLGAGGGYACPVSDVEINIKEINEKDNVLILNIEYLYVQRNCDDDNTVYKDINKKMKLGTYTDDSELDSFFKDADAYEYTFKKDNNGNYVFEKAVLKVNDKNGENSNNNVITDNKKTNDVEEKDESLLLAEELMKNFISVLGIDTYFFEKDEYTYETISNDMKIEMGINYLIDKKEKEDCNGDCEGFRWSISFTKDEFNSALDSVFGRHDVVYGDVIHSNRNFCTYRYNKSKQLYEAEAAGGGYTCDYAGISIKIENIIEESNVFKFDVKYLYIDHTCHYDNTVYKDINMKTKLGTYTDDSELDSFFKDANAFEYTFKKDNNGNYVFEKAVLK